MLEKDESLKNSQKESTEITIHQNSKNDNNFIQPNLINTSISFSEKDIKSLLDLTLLIILLF